MSDPRISPRIIAISGTSGAGKNTLADKIAERMPGSGRIDFDSYIDEWISLPLPEWVEAGAHPSQKWQTPQLASDLNNLRKGQAITLPKQGGRLELAPYIFLTEPYGRSRHDVAPYIDFVAGIYLPLEVALSRRLLRDKEWILHPSFNPGKSAEEHLERLQNYLSGYLSQWNEDPNLRCLYNSLNDCAKNNSNLVLDGLKKPDDLADGLEQAIRNRFDDIPDCGVCTS
jgi:uridine kinase